MQQVQASEVAFFLEYRRIWQHNSSNYMHHLYISTLQRNYFIYARIITDTLSYWYEITDNKT